jgi:hypothetical protein
MGCAGRNEWEGWENHAVVHTGDRELRDKELRACGGQDSTEEGLCPTDAEGKSGGSTCCCTPKQAAPSCAKRRKVLFTSSKKRMRGGIPRTAISEVCG